MHTTRTKPSIQRMEDYTAEDRLVWKTLFKRQIATLQRHACNPYIRSVKTVQFREDAIPDLDKTSAILSELTGWSIRVVPDLVPEKEFFRLLSERVFPATCWLRHYSEMDYLEEPDMFHDVFGHVPLLADRDYADFMQAFGKLALKWAGIPAAVEWATRVYWFTIEFGMIIEDDRQKIFGAGIMSSSGETAHALSATPDKLPFDIHKVMHTGFQKDCMQQTYFVIRSFRDLMQSLSAIESCITQNFRQETAEPAPRL